MNILYTTYNTEYVAPPDIRKFILQHSKNVFCVEAFNLFQKL